MFVFVETARSQNEEEEGPFPSGGGCKQPKDVMEGAGGSVRCVWSGHAQE